MLINETDGSIAVPVTTPVITKPKDGEYPAFSPHNQNVQNAWDSSSLKAIQFCPRYYQLQNLEGWQGESVHLEFGRFIADGLEHYQKLRLDGYTKEDALLRVVRKTLEDTYYEGVPEHEHGHGTIAATDDTQWGGYYETMWKCTGTEKYKNQKGNRAKCPFAFEAAWFPGDPPELCGSCGSSIHSERRYVPGDTKKNRRSLLRALIWYGFDQPDDLDAGLKPYVFPNGQPAVELSVRLPLPYSNSFGENYILTANFDYIGDFGGELFITDNKSTTKFLNDKFFDNYSPDTQFDTYDLIGSLAFPGLPIRGTLVDAISLSVEGVTFGRKPFYKTEEQREEHLKDLGVWLEVAEMYALKGYWPMNKRNCWLCPFAKACSQSPKLRAGYLASNYQQKPRWNALQVR